MCRPERVSRPTGPSTAVGPVFSGNGPHRPWRVRQCVFAVNGSFPQPLTAKLLQWPRMGQRGLTWQPLVKGDSRHIAEPPARNNAPGPLPSLARDDARSEAVFSRPTSLKRFYPTVRFTMRKPLLAFRQFLNDINRPAYSTVRLMSVLRQLNAEHGSAF